MITEDYMVRADELKPGDVILAISPNIVRFPRVVGTRTGSDHIVVEVDFENDFKLEPDHLLVVERQVDPEEL